MPPQPHRDGVATFMFVSVLAGLALAWAWSAGLIFQGDVYGEPAPEIYAAADTAFHGATWFTAIEFIYRDDNTLQVATTLLDSSDASTTSAYAIYDELWALTMQHSEWRIGMVFIYDRSGNVLCGGAA